MDLHRRDSSGSQSIVDGVAGVAERSTVENDPIEDAAGAMDCVDESTFVIRLISLELVAQLVGPLSTHLLQLGKRRRSRISPALWCQEDSSSVH